jgi:hypothetical protein
MMRLLVSTEKIAIKKITVNDILYSRRWVVAGNSGMIKIVKKTITNRDVLPAVGEYSFLNIFFKYSIF